MASRVRLTYDHETHSVCGCTTGIHSRLEGRRDRRRRRLPSCSADASQHCATTPATAKSGCSSAPTSRGRPTSASRWAGRTSATANSFASPPSFAVTLGNCCRRYAARVAGNRSRARFHPAWHMTEAVDVNRIYADAESARGANLSPRGNLRPGLTASSHLSCALHLCMRISQTPVSGVPRTWIPASPAAAAAGEAGV
jgi:hypothetical protein